MPAALLIGLYLLVSLLPLGLAWAQGLDPRTPWDELATGLGLVALSMCMVEFLLLGRFRAVTARVGSDVVMRSHQLLARAALVFAVLHPFLYVSPRDAAPVWDVTKQTVVDASWQGLWPGIAAWLLLGGLVIMAIGRDATGLRYHQWRLLHGLAAVAVAGFGTLHALRAGRYSMDDTLAWLWIGMFAFAVAALFYVYVVAPLLRLRRPFTISEVRHEADRTWVVTLTPDFDGALPYRAGQFAWLNVGHSAFSLDENPFSICSAPAAGREVQFLIKELGDFTSALDRVQTGTRAYLEAPHGHLTLAGRETAKGIALIAGGVGLAPLIGILRELRATGDTRPTTLLYGNRHAGQIAFADELKAFEEDHGTKIIHFLSEPPQDWTGQIGRVTPDFLQTEFGSPEHREWLYVLCGPPGMLRVVEDSLLALGVPHSNILSEQFVYE